MGDTGQHHVPSRFRQEPAGALASQRVVGAVRVPGAGREDSPRSAEGREAGPVADPASAMTRSGAASGAVQAADAAAVDANKSDAQMKKTRQVMVTP